MAVIGYIRVSTTDQNSDLQRNALVSIDCDQIFEDRMSGKIAVRPGLKRALKTIKAGDTLVVWKLDRLGRSVKNLIAKETEAHINPPVTKEQQITDAEEKKQVLITESTSTIAPLQDAVDLDIATQEEISALKEWKTYRVMLNRVDTSLGADVVWPTRPA